MAEQADASKAEDRRFVRLCSDGDLEGVRAALQGGVDVNSLDRDGWTGLMMALSRRHTAVARLLLGQEGIDVNIVSCVGETALHKAAGHNKNSECLATLLPQTTSVNLKGLGGHTPLWLAVRNNAVRCLKLLLSDQRTNPNNKDKGAGSFHDIRKTMKELSANHTSRYPKLAKIAPSHGCQ